MRVAIFQMSDSGEPEENIARARGAVAGCDADFFVLPEFFAFPGGDHRKAYTLEEAYALAGEPALRMLIEASAAFPGYLVGGTVLEKGGEGYYNTCFVLRHGEVLAGYRKIHLTAGEVGMGLLPGDGCVTMDTEWGRVGLLICLDICGQARDQLDGTLRRRVPAHRDEHAESPGTGGRSADRRPGAGSRRDRRQGVPGRLRRRAAGDPQLDRHSSRGRVAGL